MATILNITSNDAGITVDAQLWNDTEATFNSPTMPENVQEWVDGIEASLKASETVSAPVEGN
jgi:hypothetical protein